MRRLAFVIVLGLVAIVPPVGAEKPLPANLEPVPPLPPGGLAQSNAAPLPNVYVAPKADGSVVELLDENVSPIFAVLNNDTGGEAGTITREDRDVFAGIEAVRVTPLQRYSSRIPGWDFKIVETPKEAGEFRFMRFAWKKLGGSGIMIQLHDPVKSWAFRYFAGRNTMGWLPAVGVSEKLPGEWELVTRDLFKEFGAFTMSGFALTSFDGTAGLFDHMLLGRTIEDLDKATDAALGRVKPAKPLAGKERDTSWEDLLGTDAKKAAPALRAFLASAPDHVTFIRDRLGDVPNKEQAARVHELIRDLDADNFDTRQNATDKLIELGAPVIDAVREAGLNAPNDEVRYRCRLVLRKLGGGTAAGPITRSARLSRAVRVLERASTADARTLLGEIAEGKLAPEVASDAKAALARLPKLP